MKMLKSLISLLLVLLLMFSFTGCIHKQNEIAVEVGNTKFTAAQYSYALLMADSEAQGLVSDQLSEEGIDPYVTEVDIYARKIDNVDYVTWVENRAVELLSEYAAYVKLFTDNKLQLSSEVMEENKNYVSSYYSNFFSENGISKETFEKMVAFSSYGNEYFYFLYGKEGTKAVSSEDIKKNFNDSYRVTLILQKDVTDAKDEQLTADKENMEHIKKDLEKGDSVVDVYNEFNGLTEETEKAGTGTPAEKEEDVISVIADPDFDVNYGVTFWKDVKDIKAGEAKIMDVEENGKKYIRLIYVLEIAEDNTTYIDELDAAIRWNLKEEDYDKEIDEVVKGLNVVKHKYAMSAFKVKKINYVQ